MATQTPDASRENRAWDGSASNYTDEEYAKACVLDRGADAGTAKQRYGLPVATPGNSWSENPDASGVAAAAQRIGQVNASDAAKKTAYRRLMRCYNKLDMEAPQSVQDGARDVDMDAEMRYAVAPVTHVDVRDPSGNDDNTWTMSGYAAVFNQETTLYDGKFVKVTESIDSRAFHSVLQNQGLQTADGVVHFNFGHDMNRAVAATNVPTGQPGSLQLRADAHGLSFLAKVPRDDPDGVAMAAKMRSGVLRQASFAFTVKDDTVTTTTQDDGPDLDHRTILEIGHLYDVCATPQGAYPQTVAGLRSYAAAIGQPTNTIHLQLGQEIARQVVRLDGGHPRQPVTGGENDVSPMGGIADLKARRLSNDIERAKARFQRR